MTTQVQSGIQKQISFDTVTARLGQRIVDLSVIPVMRSIDIDFVGYKFKPGKRVYFYFDDTDVTNYVQRANEMVVTGGRFIDIQNSSERITSGTGNTYMITFKDFTPELGRMQRVCEVLNPLSTRETPHTQ